MTTAATSETVPAKRTSRWVWVALIVSLAINLLVLGIVAGAGLSWRYAAASHGGLAGWHVAAFAQKLPPARRDELRRVAAAHKEKLGSLRRQVREARREAARLLLAEPFDKAAHRAAQARLLDVDTQLRAAGSALLSEAAEAMTASERREFMSWRTHRPRRGPPPDDDDVGGKSGKKE